MLNIVEVLFLIFGWVFEKKGLIIAALVISSLFLLITLYDSGTKGKPSKSNTLALLIQIPCMALSIIKLCL